MYCSDFILRNRHILVWLDSFTSICRLCTDSFWIYVDFDPFVFLSIGCKQITHVRKKCTNNKRTKRTHWDVQSNCTNFTYQNGELHRIVTFLLLSNCSSLYENANFMGFFRIFKQSGKCKNAQWCLLFAAGTVVRARFAGMVFNTGTGQRGIIKNVASR